MPLSVEEICAGVTTQVLKHIDEHPDNNKSNQPWTACIRSVLDHVIDVPKDVQKFMLFNFMVQANISMDDPQTMIFCKFPQIMSQFGQLLKMSFLDNTTMKTCMLSVPSEITRQAFPAKYFVHNPSLEIMWYDSETKSVRSYLLTIGFVSPTVSNIGPKQLCLGKITSTDDFVSCTPITTMTHMTHFAKKEVAYGEYKSYHDKMCGTPIMDTSIKREHDEMNQLSYCKMADLIMKRQKVDISLFQIVD